MLQNVKVVAFTVSELLKENQQERARGGGEGGWVKLSPIQIRVTMHILSSFALKYNVS